MQKTALAVLLLSLSVAAQSVATFARLSGTVRDATRASVEAVIVTLQNTATNQSVQTRTDSNGFFAFPSLPPGAYTVSAQHKDFAPFRSTGVVLQVAHTATLDIELAPQMRTETITVVADAPAMDGSRTEVSHVVDTGQINALPIGGRLFTDFVLLTPGVATGRTSLQSTITEFETTRVSFGGMRDLSNLVTVDGADTINTVTGSQRGTPPQDSVSEFRVVASNFGAEYGRALGGIVNIVTKSGTNTLHGTVYGYTINDAWNARSLLQPEPSAHTLRQHQFGAAIGGPWRVERTFYFANYEGQRRAASPTFPEQLTRNLAFYNTAKTALGLSPENTGRLQTGDRDTGFLRLDHQWSDAHQVSLRMNTVNSRSRNLLSGNTVDGGGVAAPSSAHDAFVQDHFLVANATSISSTGVVNNFLLQWSRRNYDFPAVSGEPSLDLPNELMFGNHFGVFDRIAESRIQTSNATSRVKGAHLIRIGADANLLFDNVSWPGFAPMRIVVPGSNCLPGLVNYINPAARMTPNPSFGGCPLPPALHGTPVVFWSAPAGNGPLTPGHVPPPIPTTWKHAYLPGLSENYRVRLNHQYAGLFVQDQWRANPRLTVNYGVRWDFETGLDNVIRRDLSALAPRLGLAWAAGKDTVVRAGFGVFFDRYSLPFVFVTYPQRPVVIPGASLPGIRKGAESAGWILNQLTPGPGGMPAEAARNMILYGQAPAQYLTGPCPPSCTAGAALVDPKSRTPYAEQASLQISQRVKGTTTVGVNYLFVAAHHQVRAENLNVSAPAGTMPDGRNQYAGPRYNNAGLLYFTDNSGNAAYHGATLQVSQRLRRWFQSSINYTFSKTLDDGTFTTFVSTPQDLYARHLERATSNQDVRHRMVAAFTASSPAKSWLRHLDLAGLVTAQSGRPFTLFTGYDANGDTNPVTDRVGWSARNTYYGDRLLSVDFRLSRNIQLSDHTRLTFAVDAFNALNRANVEEVNSVYGFQSFLGPIPRNFGDGVGSPANPAFGTPRTVGNQRWLQASVRLVF